METIVIINENIEAETPANINQRVSGKRTVKKEGLNDALKQYSSSTNRFASSMDNLATSINKLADSNIAIAEIIKEFANFRI